jgi:hypothetical protein
MKTLIFGIFFTAYSLLSSAAGATNYWELEIPAMEGAKNIISTKDKITAIHKLTYDIILTAHTDPLPFYNKYFESNGFVHYMKETYEQYPHIGKSPAEDWSSFTANSATGKFTLTFGSLWENKTYKSNAQVILRIDELKDDKFIGHISVSVIPVIVTPSFHEILLPTQTNPVSLLKLSALVEGNPFQLDEINLNKVKSIESDDPLIIKYKELMQPIIKQFSDFADEHVPAE